MQKPIQHAHVNVKNCETLHISKISVSRIKIKHQHTEKDFASSSYILTPRKHKNVIQHVKIKPEIHYSNTALTINVLWIKQCKRPCSLKS